MIGQPESRGSGERFVTLGFHHLTFGPAHPLEILARLRAVDGTEEDFRRAIVQHVVDLRCVGHGGAEGADSLRRDNGHDAGLAGAVEKIWIAFFPPRGAKGVEFIDDIKHRAPLIDLALDISLAEVGVCALKYCPLEFEFDGVGERDGRFAQDGRAELHEDDFAVIDDELG